ncbi:hypothetical protein UA08_01644 [Talaromyces atroroseus]|uniref:Altered inheritance of mitochondria protein 9, mitochondrial n=1 Tax=Talaromyces atroroseus TaxID=1441469 RepID=A0A1Q5Q9T8_TALAT|nr:hypothetical protein UA08_01644 [Talaromyces atroroseus]OKL62703.1 hypothetical protein UA08_01644 [Talaromyces atroroseus]
MSAEQPITEDDLFKYQRHRWLRNNSKELDILKLLEGDHNKVFLLTMNDGDELIARLPNPNAGSNFYTTASEIATRRFLQHTCDVPMPKVWDWDFRDRNTVGAEWIIEEKATGQPLRNFWFAMNRKAQLEIVQQVVDLETKLAFLKFSSHGSIYLRRWLPSKQISFNSMEWQYTVLNKPQAELPRQFWRQFAIGPSTDRKLYRGPADFTKQFRGPFRNLFHYATSLAKNERRYIRYNAWRRMNPFRSIKRSQNLDQYGDLIEKYLASQEHWNQSEVNDDPCTISHPNLSLDHIFIDPATNKIVCLTGWQATVISPPFLKRPYPTFLDPEFQTESLDRSKSLPRAYYQELVEKTDPLRHKRVLSNLQEHENRISPMSAIFGGWEKDDMYSLRESLLTMLRSLESKTRGPLPNWLKFDVQTLRSHGMEKFARQELQLLFGVVQNVQNTWKIPIDGRVPAEDFDRARELSDSYRQQYLHLAEDDKTRVYIHENLWPFDVAGPEEKRQDSMLNDEQGQYGASGNYSNASFRIRRYPSRYWDRPVPR